jgi:hypothetical protein
LEGIAVKSLVVAIVSVLAAATAVSAEPLRLAQAEPVDVLHPRDVRMLVRSQGLMPVGRPVLRGTTYVVPALGDGDREVSVLVDARSGNILKITPVAVASRMPPPPPPRGVQPGPGAIMSPEGPPPPGTTYGPYERMPGPGYVSPPRAVYRVGPPPAIMQDEPGVYGGRVPAGVPEQESDLDGAAPPPPGAAPPRVITATPHPGEIAAMPDQDDAPPGQPGALPPPPERFPQRAAPVDAAKANSATKPATKPARRVAVMPKDAPLPRPRPAASAPVAPTAVPSEPVAPPDPEAKSENMPN